MCCGELCTKQEWEEHICEAELRLRSQLRAPFGPQAGDIFTHEQDPEKNGLYSTFPHPFLAAPWAFRLDLLWNHGAPQARKIDCHKQSAVKADEEERSNCL
jgi:hypothetical protein